jgi:uncharacterized protein (TIGR03790 family)
VFVIIQILFLLLTIAWNSPAEAVNANSIVSRQLAIVVNEADPESRQIAEYYKNKRNIPDENIIVVDFPVKGNFLAKNEFQKIYKEVIAKTPKHVQFYALAWSRPFKVACMSMTSALTFGYDEKYCAKSCKSTEPSPYFNSRSRVPYDDFGIRPSMMLAGSSVKQVYRMIDRGVRSDGTHPDGTAYLVSTTDKARNVRASMYSSAIVGLSERVAIQQVNANALKDKNDVLFYFTGSIKVNDIGSNRFIDGAIADHLTSTGGRLFGGKQMSILRWLDAGATASYGTVVEPCAFAQKFPFPAIVIDYYTRGETLIESYWKSVAWPGQGVFVGEPLASPFSRWPVNRSVNNPVNHVGQ